MEIKIFTFPIGHILNEQETGNEHIFSSTRTFNID